MINIFKPSQFTENSVKRVVFCEHRYEINQTFILANPIYNFKQFLRYIKP